MPKLRHAVYKAGESVAPGLMHRLRIHRGARDEAELALLPALCSGGALAIDVGAHRGLYVHHLRPFAQQIIAFEPNPVLAHELSRYYPQVRVEAVALSDSDSIATLRMPTDLLSWATIATSNTLALADPEDGYTSFQVSTARLDTYDLSDVCFIKVDVEGHEEAVIRGATLTIERCKPYLLIECEERHNHGGLSRIVGRLSRHRGYYLDGVSLRQIEQFVPEADQPTNNVSPKGKRGRYINNFMFVPEDEVRGFEARVHSLLAGRRGTETH